MAERMAAKSVIDVEISDDSATLTFNLEAVASISAVKQQHGLGAFWALTECVK